MRIQISELMAESGVGFGTSGARGLVTAMTDHVCYAYTVAFLQHLEEKQQTTTGMEVAIAGDLRPSTGRIMNAVAKAASDRGYRPVDCGKIPSPAIALHGLNRRIAAIMVTGSHIPEDRNGIKFNGPDGEILKEDETSIRSQSVLLPDTFDSRGQLQESGSWPSSKEAGESYVQRYLKAFPKDLLKGKRLGLYAHSAVGKDLMQHIYEALGAQVTRLGESDIFVPVDTEAIREEDVQLGKRWAREEGFDAMVSTDGDSDRPLIADEYGEWIRGDVAGILCAQRLGADVVVTPVSSNSAVEACGAFDRVVRTRIGSPYVVAAMQQAVREGASRVVGYEANGGFLTASTIPTPWGSLDPLPTRDAVIVHLSLLWAAIDKGCTLRQLLENLPSRFTFSDRLKNYPTETSQNRLVSLKNGGIDAIGQAFHIFGQLESVDFTDGMRMRFHNGLIVHIRPSGNAPELRCYTEATTLMEAQRANARAMKVLDSWR